MTALTVRELEKLGSVEWFRSVGETYGDPRVAHVDSWFEAVALAASSRTERLRCEAVDFYRERIWQVSVDRWRLWNDIVKDVQRLTVPMVADKTTETMRRIGLPRIFRDWVEGDVTGFAVEMEYGDIMAPGLYTGLSFDYYSGHFPCGWDGEPPAGRTVVY